MRFEAGGEAGCGRRDLLPAVGLFVGFLGLYLRTLCPTVYLGDGGDFCAAIATGGIPHPPGYPLFCLLGRAALAVIPWGEPAFRIGCVVALAAAGAVAALYLLVRELGCSPWASAAGAAAFGVSFTFWSQATRVEVYSLHVLLVTLMLLSALRYRRTGTLGSLAGAALAGSLGLAHHLTIALLAPTALLICGRRLWKEPGLEYRLAVAGVLLQVGPLFYLLLMLWAQAEPLHAWGRPVTPFLLWNHASAHIFRIFFEMPDGAYLGHVLPQMGAFYTDNFPYLLFLLPFVGGWLLWKRDRELAGALLLAAVIVAGYTLFYRINDISVYYLPAWIVAAALLAVAVDAACEHARGMVRLRAVACVGLVVLLGALLARNWGNCDLSGATWVRELARHKLENADPHSVLITQGDSDTHPIWYVHDVLRVRPDVLPIDRPFIGGRTWGLYDWDPSLWYLYRLRRQGVPAPVDVPEDPAARLSLARDGYLIRLLDRELRGRPICATFAMEGSDLFRWLRQRHETVPVGIVLRMHPKGRAVDLPGLLRQNERLWAGMALPELRGVRTDQEISPDYVTHHYACMLVNFAGLYEMSGNLKRAETLYRRAAEWAPRYAPAAQALASVRRQRASRG